MDRTNLVIGLGLGAAALAWRLRALARLPRAIRAQRRLARMRRRREGAETMDFDGMMTKLEWLDREVGRMESEIARLTRERDALLGMVTGRCDDQWGGHFALVEIRPSPFSVTDHHGRSNHVALCQWCETEAQAVAAARRAAGLAGEG